MSEVTRGQSFCRQAAEDGGDGPAEAALGYREAEVWSGQDVECRRDAVAEEVPVALVFNGVSHAVMLATPGDLEDFAIGFSLSEGIVADRREILDLEIEATAAGMVIGMRLLADRDQALRGRRRALAGRTGCGLCGTESLEQVIGSCARVGDNLRLGAGALLAAERGMLGRQALFRLTGAVHAAAWCSPEGEVRMVREDVGRHNALDKLIGGLARENRPAGEGFVLMSSRASYEIVQKAARAGIELVAALSAPTGMAVRMADAAGLTLVGFVRAGRFTAYTHSGRVRRVH